MEFVNLNQEDSLINVDSDSYVLNPREPIPGNSDTPQLNYEPIISTNSEEFNLLESCGIEKFYGDPSKEGYFKLENLFSELVSDYQRAKARYNLGIAEEGALV
jgi:hypothetical protein